MKLIFENTTIDLTFDFENQIKAFLPNTKSWEQDILNFIKDWLASTSTFETTTSGSTSLPKKIQMSKESMENSANATLKFLKIPKSSTMILALPAKYISGKMMLVRAILSNSNLICLEPSLKIKLKHAETYSLLALTPPQFLLMYDENPSQFNSIKNLLLGGAACHHQVIKRAQNLKNQVFETYGMTETVSHIALKNLKEKDANFKLLTGIRIALDERNCLEIEAPSLHSKKIQTNDLAEIINKNEFKILGRIDNVINSGGLKIYPEEIEKVLEPFIPGNFMIGGIPDENFGEVPILLVENSNPKIDFSNLLERFPKNKLPKQYINIPQFAFTESGKIHRKNTLEKALKLEVKSLF